MAEREVDERIATLMSFVAKNAKLRKRVGLAPGKAADGALDPSQMSQGKESSSEGEDEDAGMRRQGSLLGQTVSVASTTEARPPFTDAQRLERDRERERILKIQAKFKKNFKLINVLEEDETVKSVGSDTHRGFTKEDNEFENEGKITFAIKKLNQELKRKNSMKVQQNNEEKNDEEDGLQQKLMGENALLNAMHKYQASQKVAQISEIEEDKVLNPLDMYYKVVDDK